MGIPQKNQNRRYPALSQIGEESSGPRVIESRRPGIMKREHLEAECTRQQREEFLKLDFEVEFKRDSYACCDHSFTLLGSTKDENSGLVQAAKVCHKCGARATFELTPIMSKGKPTDKFVSKLMEYDVTPVEKDKRQ